ncbi:MAG: MIP/aquaporin family protein [Thermoleophilia bacterium]
MKWGRVRAVELLAEFAGTFWLVLIGGGAIMLTPAWSAQSGVFVALSFGVAVASAVICFGRVSGAHINPVVTLALACAGRFPWDRVPSYAAVQAAGALLAATILRVILGSGVSVGATLPSVSDGSAVLLEALLTAVLVAVVLLVVARPWITRPLAAVLIGSTVALEAWWAGPLTGASMNPARSFGPAVLSGNVDPLWVYVVGPAFGAVLGVLAVRVAGGRAASAWAASAERRASYSVRKT